MLSGISHRIINNILDRRQQWYIVYRVGKAEHSWATVKNSKSRRKPRLSNTESRNVDFLSRKKKVEDADTTAMNTETPIDESPIDESPDIPEEPKARCGKYLKPVKAFWNHPAGPKTIFFWAPAFKWGLVLAGITDLWRPAHKISLLQSLSLTMTGLIWSRYSMVIIPKNWSLFSVNFFVFISQLFQFIRAIIYQYFTEKPDKQSS